MTQFQMSAISLRNIDFSYSSEEKVINQLTLDINEGEFVTFVGRSGCGKSTILRIIAGILVPSSGTSVVDREAKIGMVFQDPVLLPWRSVAKNVELGMETIGVPQTQRKIFAKNALRKVGLTNSDNAFPNVLSGGMQQRVAIARAIAADPSLLLLDEPFSALDYMSREELQEVLEELLELSRRTTVLVTHDIGEAVYLSDRVLVLHPVECNIIREFSIRLSKPRREERFSKGFLSYVREIRDTLRKVE